MLNSVLTININQSKKMDASVIEACPFEHKDQYFWLCFSFSCFAFCLVILAIIQIHTSRIKLFVQSTESITY